MALFGSDWVRRYAEEKNPGVVFRAMGSGAARLLISHSGVEFGGLTQVAQGTSQLIRREHAV